ncbi:TonB-dependent receptor family protein [Rheinheimera sp. MMS21-TC3]|uniref:TonB-dependent receptor family protein n=1 Tax=Rheinheimera sp. MMS21-TC3 TaxID=3072790 RepID=UPI0028C45ABD|nr:TonB-dependent receptor [Rheinheimera sp. MMS21-TC3]WNO60210.1 TonB-dependent receptor [Rheinheimera sp. MMS21-TC3]
MQRKTTFRLALLASLFITASLTKVSASSPDLTNTASQAELDTHAAQTEAELIERIVVTATRTEQPWLSSPASIDTLLVTEQQPGMRTDMAEILAGIPGVQIDTRYNFAQDTRIILRGFGARAAFGVRGILMRLDGVPLSMPDGQAQTSSIFIDEPSQVEVLRGPIAAVYGNAAGGIINLQSQPAASSYMALSHAIGANDRQRSRLDAAMVKDTFSVSGHYARFRTDGDRDHASAERDQYALRGTYQLANNIELIARVDDNNAPLLQDPGSLTSEQWQQNSEQTFAGASKFNTRKSIRHRQQSLTVNQQLSHSDWQMAAWSGVRAIEQFLPFRGNDVTSSGGVIDLKRDFHGVHGQFNWRPQAFASRWQLSLGTDIERQKDTRQGFVNNFGAAGELRRDETGRVEKNDIYTLSTLALTDKLTWLAGLRLSHLSFNVSDRYIIQGVVPDDSGQTSYQETSWTSGLNYQLTSQWALFTAVGNGFETPTLTELAYRNQGTGLNPNLGPALISQYEAGVKWLSVNGNGQAQLSLFRIDSNNEIVVDQSIDGRTTYRNAAQTEREGAELSWRYQLHPALQLRGAATLMKARYRDEELNYSLNGLRIPGIADSNVFIQANYRPWHNDKIQASIVVQYRSRVATSDSNDEFAPAYMLWHASLDAKQKSADWHFSQWLRLDNILDKNYVGSVVVNQSNGRSFEPAPGRQLSAGIGVERRF